MSVEFSFAALSDIGLLRKNNQASGYAGPALLVIADGMVARRAATLPPQS